MHESPCNDKSGSNHGAAAGQCGLPGAAGHPKATGRTRVGCGKEAPCVIAHQAARSAPSSRRLPRGDQPSPHRCTVERAGAVTRLGWGGPRGACSKPACHGPTKRKNGWQRPQNPSTGKNQTLEGAMPRGELPAPFGHQMWVDARAVGLVAVDDARVKGLRLDRWRKVSGKHDDAQACVVANATEHGYAGRRGRRSGVQHRRHAVRVQWSAAGGHHSRRAAHVKPTDPPLHKNHVPEDERYRHKALPEPAGATSPIDRTAPPRRGRRRRSGRPTGRAATGFEPKDVERCPTALVNKTSASPGPTVMGGSMAPGTRVQARGTPNGSACRMGCTVWLVMMQKGRTPHGRTETTEQRRTHTRLHSVPPTNLGTAGAEAEWRVSPWRGPCPWCSAGKGPAAARPRRGPRGAPRPLRRWG